MRMYAKRLLISVLGLSLCIVCSIQSTNGARFLVKRQALVDRLGNAASGAITGFSSDGKPPTPKPSASLTLPSASSNQKLPAPSNNANPDDDSNTQPLDDINPTGPANDDKSPPSRPQKPTGESAAQLPDIDDAPPKRKPPSRRPSNRPNGVTSATSFVSSIPNRRNPNKKQHDDYDSSEDDDDYSLAHSDSSPAYYDDRDDYGSSMMEPMRHMKGMFARIFNNLPDMDSMYDGDYDNNNGNIAMASSYSTGDGYARSRSTVSNNGRMRGILSETRNGRTRTRRIGSADDDDDEY